LFLLPAPEVTVVDVGGAVVTVGNVALVAVGFLVPEPVDVELSQSVTQLHQAELVLEMLVVLGPVVRVAVVFVAVAGRLFQEGEMR